MTATDTTHVIETDHGAAPQLRTLAATSTGRVLLPGDAGFEALVTPWNLAVRTSPLAVVEAADARDVAAAIRCAAEMGVQVDVRATGHGATPVAGPHLLVHTKRLDELVVDPVTATARIGAGVTWQSVLDAAAQHGLAGLAGSAPHVGVVGYLTGGGLGPVARTFGIASDHVIAFDVVTGDGEVRRATAEESPELFWGLRGGKGVLGVVTAVETRLLPVREIYAGCAYFAGEDAAPVLHAYRAWTRTLPEQATSSVAVLRLPPLPGVPEPLAGKVSVAVRFAWVGDPADGERTVAPMLAAAPVLLGGYGVMPYAALGAIHADPVAPAPACEAAALLSELTAEAVDTLVVSVGAGASCPLGAVELRHLGGAVRRLPEVASAFDHRDAAFSLLALGIGAPDTLAAAAEFSRGLLEALSPWSTGGSLPNFEASGDPGVVTRKYAEPTLRRLAQLSAALDPHRVLVAAEPVRRATAGL